MMIKITNIGGLLSLLYLWYNECYWTLSINTTNIVSPYIVNSIQKLPDLTINFLMITMVILYLRSFLLKKKALVMYCISLGLLEIVIQISISLIMLKNSATCLLFDLHHTLPLENLRISYFNQELIYNIMLQKPTILTSHHALHDLSTFMNNSINYDVIKQLNAYEIHHCARYVVDQHINASFTDIPTYYKEYASTFAEVIRTPIASDSSSTITPKVVALVTFFLISLLMNHPRIYFALHSL
jgi:hypothetical protein